MKLNTTGNMQVNGFKRSLGTGVMKLNLLDANDRASPEYHLGIKEKNYWKKLSHGQKKGFLKRAGVQTEDDTSTFSVPSGRSFSGTYTVDHGRKQSSMKPTVMKPTAMKPAAMKQSALKPTESSQVSLRTENVSADSRGWKKEEKMHDPFGDIRASPYIKKPEKQGNSQNIQTREEPVQALSGYPQAARNDSVYQTRTEGASTQASRHEKAPGYGPSFSVPGNSMEKKGGSSGVQAAGNQAKETAKSGGTIAIKAAREAARIIKQDISLAMQKEEEQRKFHCESILAEESGQGPAASPGTSEMGIQKAVSVMIAAVFAAVQAALSFLLPFVGVAAIVLSLLAGLFSILFGSATAGYVKANVSPECESYRPLVTQYAAQYGMTEYIELILAVMMQESGGTLPDVMQAAEGGFNTRYPHVPNGIPDPEYSIECGVQELKRALELAGCTGPTDMEHIRLALQGYNFGEGYITWAIRNYGGYSPENAAEFSDMMAARMGWSGYGDKNYVEHVLRYYQVVYGGGFENVPEGGMAIPLYDQKDYGDVPFGGGSIATSGCAPTSFAMVASYLLGSRITPVDAMQWCGNAYYVPGAGTGWGYFYGAASHFGLKVAETSDPGTVLAALAQGKPVISSQGPGLFTSFGHFIVLRGVTFDGRVLVNDPNDSPAKNYASRAFDMGSEIHPTSRNYWIFER